MTTTHIKPPEHRTSARPRVVRIARARVGQEQGAALVEFALVLPVMLMVLFGIAQFGLALNSANDETHIANEVARYAIVDENPSTESLQKWAKTQVDTPKALAGQTICIAFPVNATTKTSGQIGDPVEVKVQGAINWLPILKLEAASTNVTGTAVMRLEALPSYKAGCA